MMDHHPSWVWRVWGQGSENVSKQSIENGARGKGKEQDARDTGDMRVNAFWLH
jgi:hypothetical protein